MEQGKKILLLNLPKLLLVAVAFSSSFHFCWTGNGRGGF